MEVLIIIGIILCVVFNGVKDIQGDPKEDAYSAAMRKGQEMAVVLEKYKAEVEYNLVQQWLKEKREYLEWEADNRNKCRWYSAKERMDAAIDKFIATGEVPSRISSLGLSSSHKPYNPKHKATLYLGIANYPHITVGFDIDSDNNPVNWRFGATY